MNFVELQNISIKDIKLDKTNPNQMSGESYEALKKVIDKYGYLVPVIVDQNNRIVDGEHRYRALKEAGEESIPVYKIEVGKDDAKMLRQIMNKLRGEHDETKDAREFKILEESGHLDELADLIQQDEKKMRKMIESLGDEEFVPNERETHELIINEKYKITFTFDKMPDYEQVLSKLHKINAVSKEQALLKLCE